LRCTDLIAFSAYTRACDGAWIELRIDRMSDLAKLRIWDDPAIHGALSWYLDVSKKVPPEAVQAQSQKAFRLAQ
jgi:hypothetical protein